jgi:N-methylhydantoinase B
MESKCPLLIHEYRLGTDSGGAGRQRGGLNIEKKYEVLNDRIDVSLWFDRTRTPAWGLFGGEAGSVPEVIFQPDTSKAYRLLKVNHLPLATNTLFRVSTGGGGGYGLPPERPVELVQDDLLDEYISRRAAESIYKIRLKADSLEIDRAATARARSQAGH